MNTPPQADNDKGLRLRALTAADLGPVIEIDRAITGRARRAFFEKRLAAALADPGAFIYVGAEQDDRLCGYALARVLAGEFGTSEPVATLDAIGVDPAHQGRGIARALMARLEAVLRDKGVAELRTEEAWTNLAFLGFLSRAGFGLAARQVLELSVTEALAAEASQTEAGP